MNDSKTAFDLYLKDHSYPRGNLMESFSNATTSPEAREERV